jgi:hypothetical protein
MIESDDISRFLLGARGETNARILQQKPTAARKKRYAGSNPLSSIALSSH